MNASTLSNQALKGAIMAELVKEHPDQSRMDKLQAEAKRRFNESTVPARKFDPVCRATNDGVILCAAYVRPEGPCRACPCLN